VTTPPPGRSAQVRDPQALKALAHPLRGHLLGLLRIDGPSTATRLAGRVGESSGATSYHLRQLEHYGFVGELRREGRERWWQALHQVTSWEADDLLGQPGGLEANEQMQRHQIELMGRQLKDWADHGRRFGPEWASVAGISDYVLRLTPAQARQCTEEVYAVLDRWSADHSAPAESTETVAFLTAVVPFGELP
jgi:DNA-binding transcriptional ArsR family regulator